jgi:carbamoyltransferase
MTTTCAVHHEWRDRVPAIVHVDGTARPQIIHRRQNPLYYDVLQRYEELTGEAALINTSFNAHEEPIINTPQECARALVDNRVDAVLTSKALWFLPSLRLGADAAF